MVGVKSIRLTSALSSPRSAPSAICIPKWPWSLARATGCARPRSPRPGGIKPEWKPPDCPSHRLERNLIVPNPLNAMEPPRRRSIPRSPAFSTSARRRPCSTLGSSAVHATRRFYADSAAAARSPGLRGLLLTGAGPESIPPNLPAREQRGVCRVRKRGDSGTIASAPRCVSKK